MKSQINPIVPVAALVVATLAAGATMWQGLFTGAAAGAPRSAGAATTPPAADAPKRKAAQDGPPRPPTASDKPSAMR